VSAQKITYWLYYFPGPGAPIVDAVRLPAGASDDTVKAAALELARRAPMYRPDITPDAHESAIRRAVVVTFPDGN